MFINEYLMDHKRYEKWSVPKFYKLRIFYIYIVVFIIAAVAYWYFGKVGAPFRWQTLAIVIMFLAVYRGVFVNWMKANKMYRLMKQKYFDDKPWLTRIELDDKCIMVYVNDRYNNDVHWDKIKKCCVAKSFIALRTENPGEAAILDKECFTKGDTESFLTYMKTHHMDIPIVEEDPKFNR